MPLQPESRANLKNLLVKNIHSTEAGRIEQLWLSEAKHRRDEVRSGKVKTIPGPEGLRRVRDTLKRLTGFQT